MTREVQIVLSIIITITNNNYENKKLLFLLLAAMLHGNVSVNAQSNNTLKMTQSQTSLKGDANGDKVADIADFVAVHEIMKEGEGIGENIKYYWYAGQVKPMSMSTEPTTSDEYLCNNWFELGEEMPNEIHQLIKGGTMDGGAWYVAVPYANNQTYYPGYPNDIDNSVPWTDEFIEVNGISYHIFEYGGSTGTRCCPQLQKFDENLFIVIPPFYVIKYGDEIPDLSEQSYRVINTAGKTLSNPIVLTTEATNHSPVGGYEIFADMSSVEEDVLLYKTPWINIRKAPLTIGVQNVTLAEGEPIPTFSLTYEGWRNDDTEETAFITKPTATTIATSHSKAGTYAITISGGEANNYRLNYIDGTMTIEVKKGDVNGNGTVDADDVLCVSNYILGKNPSPFNESAADLTGNGVVDIEDVTSLVDIILSGKTYGYFYFGTTEPTAENFTSLPGAVASYTSIGEAVGATVSVDNGETLYMLCPAAWMKGKHVEVEDGGGNTYDFIEDTDAGTISGYVIYKTQAFNEATDVMLKFNNSSAETYYWYVGATNPSSISSTIEADTTKEGWHEIGTSLDGFNLTFNNQNMIEFDNKTQYYLVIPNDLHVYAADGNTILEGRTFNEVTSNIINHKTFQYYTSVYEVKGVIIK